MKNNAQLIKDFIIQQKDKIENFNNENIITIKTYNFILNYIDSLDETKLLGELGYFWNYEDDVKCIFGKLRDLDYTANNNEIYRCAYKEGYKNFSLTIPEHLK
jgi:hypothetical protein